MSIVLAFACVTCACSSAGEREAGPKNAEFYYSLAVNNYYDQHAQEALIDLESCFELNPDHVMAHNLAGLIRMGRKEYADSMVHFKQAIELAPRFFEVQANLGALYIALQDWHKALEILSPLLSETLYQTPHVVENNVGWALYNLKKYGQAELHLQRALFLNDDMCLAYNNLGIVHVAQERWLDALDDFDAAIKRCPHYVEAYFRAGTVLQKRGRWEEASKRFRKCRNLGGESVYGRRCRRKLQVMK